MFELSISHDNAAFETDRVAETIRILRELTIKLELPGDGLRHDAKGTYSAGIRDINGNTCGRWSFTPRTTTIKSWR